MDASFDITTISDDDLATLAKSVQDEQERRTVLATAATRLSGLLADYITAGGKPEALTITAATA